MSAVAYESPAQYERDLRSANKEYKRDKDASAKWALGRDAMPGVKLGFNGEVINNPTEAQLAHSRPQKAWSKRAYKKEHNIVKMRGNWEMPSNRVKGKYAAHEEMNETSRSITDLLPLVSPTPRARQNSVSDNILYSFDRAETTPVLPLTLDIFVKEVPRATERQVEREYEVLDHNGEVLRGRKARRNLRQSKSDSSFGRADETTDEDDFELV